MTSIGAVDAIESIEGRIATKDVVDNEDVVSVRTFRR